LTEWDTGYEKLLRQSQKKLPETDAIFNNIKNKDLSNRSPATKRLSLDCKATVNLGEFSRSGVTRGENQALDHDFGSQEKYIPFGIVDEDSAQLYLLFGSSYKTSDFIVDGLQNWWNRLPVEEQTSMELLQLKIDNGPESSGVRTQFLNRIVEFADQIGKPIQLLYYPPYHSKYNPIERCWGILEKHWNGTLLRDVNTMLSWAQTMTWRGIHPIVELNRKIYAKSISLSKTAMKAIEKRLQRNSELPKWDILIQPLAG
jgi:transposase